MLGRRARYTTLAHLSLLIAVTACSHATARSARVSPPQPAIGARRTANADVRNPPAPQHRLALATESGSTVINLRDDSATTSAIRAFIGKRTSELTVESDSAGSVLLLKPNDRSGGYARLFVVDGVPLADGFVLSIRTRWLERIEVLDDSLSKAPYGRRATRGVVLISTNPAR